MDMELTIQQVADRTGLSVHTLRYYERIGLMDPVHRTPNGRRSYKENDIEWIVLLIHLRSTEMPIAEMQQFASLVRQGDSTISDRCVLLEAHERKLLEQYQELQTTLALLSDKIGYYRSWEMSQHEKKPITG
ncbi:MerR family transcriptional regulator [Paenibacillus sp. FSL H7-0331]|uniref:MerR family transcriptional regulator n=1 Tax=Paenibacillus sp. FSL H7-0331 TaxID=1920421 RepID=UPI00096CA439|nr:MerR family transcriptional regulator [Paenibacillus sp. FSL H7-0331]OMF04788.1 hypothetical protein BK127_33645 [Paenibacillus sp. FSL H7-0331]